MSWPYTRRGYGSQYSYSPYSRSILLPSSQLGRGRGRGRATSTSSRNSNPPTRRLPPGCPPISSLTPAQRRLAGIPSPEHTQSSMDVDAAPPPSPSSVPRASSQPSYMSSSATTSFTSMPSSQTAGGLASSQAFPSTQALEIEHFGLTQEEEDELPIEFYAVIETKVVGVRYYSGHAQPGESVLCRREPSNQYDSNAIRVDNVLRTQIGHIPRVVASKLASYMDKGDLVIEAKLNGEKTSFEVPIHIYLYGPTQPTERAELETRLKADRLVKAAELNKSREEAEFQRKLLQEQAELDLDLDLILSQGAGAASSTPIPTGLKSSGSAVSIKKAIEPVLPKVFMADLHKTSQAVKFKRGDLSVLDEGLLSSLPMAAQPACLLAKLLPYQLQGLAWLTAKEDPQFPAPGSDDSTQLWQRDSRGKYNNMASRIMLDNPPKLISGGILADDMGLGKTLQVISLIMTGGPGTTLIVAPVTVMSNWREQMQRHVKPEHVPKILIYHAGNKRAPGQSFKDYFSQYDVVITTYGKIASDFKIPEKGKESTGLYEMDWRRIVLDEGHTIRNSKTKGSQAAAELKTRSRWLLTGTPIVNGVKDLHAILLFLGMECGVEDLAIFKSKITRPLEHDDPTALILLQNIFRDLCLRRKKDMKFVDLKLPPKQEYVHKISFRCEEKMKYDILLAEAQGMLEEHNGRRKKKALKTGKGGQSSGNTFQNVLSRLLRMRQTCNHWVLCKEQHEELPQLLEDQGVVELNPKNIVILQQALGLWLESQEDCPICLRPSTDVLITHCKHVFCRECITRVVKAQAKCPMCRHKLQEENLLEPTPESHGEDAEFDGEMKSSKTEALIQILRATMQKDGSKVVVFSQWTRFLNIIEKNLINAGIKFMRVDGSMSPAARDRSISALENDPEVRVMLASLAVCSVGINLVCADTVILCDSWWAPAIEDQAVDRVHRLGQKRETTVWRLVMEDSIEQRVLDIQAKKREIVSKAFQEKEAGVQRKKAQETRLKDIMKLLS